MVGPVIDAEKTEETRDGKEIYCCRPINRRGARKDAWLRPNGSGDSVVKGRASSAEAKGLLKLNRR